MFVEFLDDSSKRLAISAQSIIAVEEGKRLSIIYTQGNGHNYVAKTPAKDIADDLRAAGYKLAELKSVDGGILYVCVDAVKAVTPNDSRYDGCSEAPASVIHFADFTMRATDTPFEEARRIIAEVVGTEGSPSEGAEDGQPDWKRELEKVNALAAKADQYPDEVRELIKLSQAAVQALIALQPASSQSNESRVFEPKPTMPLGSIACDIVEMVLAGGADANAMETQRKELFEALLVARTEMCRICPDHLPSSCGGGDCDGRKTRCGTAVHLDDVFEGKGHRIVSELAVKFLAWSKENATVLTGTPAFARLVALIDAAVCFEKDMFMQCYREALFAELGKSDDDVLKRIERLAESISSETAAQSE